MEKSIPCLDLKQQHKKIHDELFEAFEEVYSNTAFSGGRFVEEFEVEFAKFCGAKYASGVASGTAALHLGMLALNIGPGDEVILPANTFIATVWGVSYVGATPVFVDCDPETWEIDPTKIEAAITSKTKAIAGVHLYGQPFDVDAVLAICKKHNLVLIEDAAQAHGALYKGKPVGTFGELSCFSFYPGKNLGACGEGGGVVTNNHDYDEAVKILRNHGSKTRYYHDEIGFNYRMGGFEGASLKIKLKYLSGWNASRQKVAARYLSEITNPKVTLQKQPEWSKSVFHLFVVTVEDRDDFVTYLEKNNIRPAYHYPVPCHLQEAYRDLGHKEGDFPHSEYLASHCVSLPMFPELTEEEINHVINVVNGY